MQSLTQPLQGFFNAIVYGWTQGDFVEIVGDKDSPDERAALIHNFPMEKNANHDNHQLKSPGIGLDKTVALMSSVNMSDNDVMGGTINDNHEETEYSEIEEESSLSQTITVHRV